MIENFDSPVTRHLDALGIYYDLIAIPLDPDKKPVRSLEDLLLSQNRNPERIVRSLLFKSGSDRFVLLAIAGAGRADWGLLRNHLKERRLAMAEPEDVLNATGYPVGAVPPFALPGKIRVLLDRNVFDHDRVVTGSGVLGYALELASADLGSALQDAEIGQFIKR